MFVQIIENWSDIEGDVRACYPSPDRAGFWVMEVMVDKVNSVPGFANLLADLAGKSLVILIPEELIKSQGVAPGVKISCRVRRADLNRTFVHPNYVTVRR